MTKVCSKCGIKKPLTAYYVKAGKSLRPECKSCSKSCAHRKEQAPAVHQPLDNTANPWENLYAHERPDWNSNARYIPQIVETHQYARYTI